MIQASRRLRLIGAVAPLVLLLTFVGGAQAADGEFAVNGTFDTDLAGWTVPSSGGCGNTVWVSDGNPGGSAWLNACGEAGSDPSIEQVLTGLVVGEVYTLSGEYRSVAPSFGDPAKPDAFEVELDGTVILSLARPTPVATAWTAFTVDFTATATSHTIAFYAERDGDDSDFAIDNVSVVGETEPAETASPSATAAATVVPTVPPTDTAPAPTSPSGPLGAALAALALVTTVAVLSTRLARSPRRDEG